MDWARWQNLSKNFKILANVLRVHQWVKNLLVFIPFFAAHQFTDLNTWVTLIIAFLSFSLCASAVYIINDLLDLESDRQHPLKSNRPFAASTVSIRFGIILIPLLLIGSVGLAFCVNTAFLSCLLLYFVLTSFYSWWLKRIILIDCLILAILYTLRIVAGAAAASLTLSFWLLAFSVFLFLSLAFVKRYAELAQQSLNGQQKTHGRGYYTSDKPLLQMFGVASGYVSVLVLALYLNSNAIVPLYPAPEFIWGAVPVMLFWISWIWMQAHRGHLYDDPLVFAVKDKASYLAGAAFVLTLILGVVG